jgi:hypothetical protein
MRKSTSAGFAFLIYCVAFADTNVGGGYYNDHVWSLAQSPYLVTQDVVLFPGYRLTIEPGVTVRFADNTGLTIRGELSAAGTAADSIVFTSGGSGTWTGITIANSQGGKGALGFVKVSHASSAINVECCGGGGPLTVTHSRFFTNDCVSSSYAGWAMTFDSCVFENNATVFTSADKIITNSIFRNNGYGLNATERVSVSNCVFTGHSQVALYGGRGTVRNAIIINNHIGIKGFFEGFAVEKSTIADNDTGIILSNYDGGSQPITDNNIMNRIMNVVNTGPYNVEIRYNWWGTCDTNKIHAKIFDGFDDPHLGLVLQPIYMDSIGKNPSVLTIAPSGNDSSTVRDTATGTAVTIHTGGAVSGRLAVCKGQYTSVDSNSTLVKSIDIAPTSDLTAMLDTAKLTLYYGDKDFSGLSQGDFQIYWLHDTVWQNVGGIVDTGAKTVTANITHFSTYGIVAAKNTATAAIRHETPLKTALYTGRPMSGAGQKLAYSIKKAGVVNIEIYDILGCLVSVLERRMHEPGFYQCPVNSGNARLPAGFYFVRMQTADIMLTSPLTIVR